MDIVETICPGVIVLDDNGVFRVDPLALPTWGLRSGLTNPTQFHQPSQNTAVAFESSQEKKPQPKSRREPNQRNTAPKPRKFYGTSILPDNEIFRRICNDGKISGSMI
jgi:hypothetical protein